MIFLYAAGYSKQYLTRMISGNPTIRIRLGPKGGRAEERETGSILHDFTQQHIQHTSHQTFGCLKTYIYFAVNNGKIFYLYARKKSWKSVESVNFRQMGGEKRKNEGKIIPIKTYSALR